MSLTHTRPSGAAAPTPSTGRPGLRRASLGTRLARGVRTPGGMVFVLVLALLAAVVIANPGFGEPESLMRFVGRNAPFALVAIGQYFVIVSGELDLSMGSVIAMQVVLAGNLIGQDEGRIVPVLLLMLVLGTVIGLVNGLLTTVLRVPSFIVTLGMMLALAGYVRYLTGGAPSGNPHDSFRQIGRGVIDDVPVLGVLPFSVLVLLVVVVLAVLITRSPFGRTLVGAGDNPDTARFAGVSLWWLKTRAFMLSSLSATLAAILLVGYAGVHPQVGSGYEFTAITAVVLGGVVLGGGRGWVLSALAGAFALELLFTLLNFVGVQSTWRDSVQGAIIIVAVAVGARTWHRRRGRPRAVTPGAGPPPDDARPTPPATGT